MSTDKKISLDLKMSLDLQNNKTSLDLPDIKISYDLKISLDLENITFSQIIILLEIQGALCPYF